MNIYKSNTHAHLIGWNTWHFEWCTKYRYKVLKRNYIKNICSIVIVEAAKRHKIDVVDMEVDTDHVHVIAGLPMTMDPIKALQLLKGFSARLIFAIVPNLRKRYPKGHIFSPNKKPKMILIFHKYG
ncbi:MAG: IS200/IS605 family transposase [Nanoarchaeota archaeon]|nr:IS200/IS605 family transposase [Nanoarchaeota archaeon]